jgi:hypothetical protein
MPPAIARPCTLLDVLVAIHAIPPLPLVRQSDGILHVYLAPVERHRGCALDHEVLILRGADLDELRVRAGPVADLVARVVDDVHLPFGGGS